MFSTTLGTTTYRFDDLPTLLARATPYRSGDALAGIAAETAEERVAAQLALADLPLRRLLDDPVIPYETDEVTRLICDTHDAIAFAPISHLTVGGLRDWLLSDAADTATLSAIAPGLTPEMVAAASKLCRLQDLMVVAARCRVSTQFRNTIGLPGRLSVRLQPNHPTDDPAGIAAAILDGLLLGAGDAVIGINPATDSPERTHTLLCLLEEARTRLAIPTQSCVLAHVTTTLELIRRGSPVDLVFQSIGGTEATNRSFGIDLALLREAQEAGLSLARGTVGDNVMYFETGQGSALSAGAHAGVDQQTLEARAYAVARRFRPLLVNTVVGFIGPEYLADGKQIVRAGLEDHFCGKLLGVPMGCDVCYTNHAEADGDDMDALLAMLVVAGVNFVMGVPGADDIMLGYQSTSFHDALAMRELLGRRPAPEFEAWLERQGLLDRVGRGPPTGIARTDAGAAALTIPVNDPVDDPGNDPGDDPWLRLRPLTAARIGLATAGGSLATAPLLALRLAHARARDAVHTVLDTDALAAAIGPLHVVHSAAQDRTTYLLRPDLGRRLADGTMLPGGDDELAIVLADGLSATAVQAHAPPLVAALLPLLAGWRLAPLVVARHGRVAIGDAVATALGAGAALVLIGERPGLSAPDSLGAYLTWRPGRATSDADRNCVSNIRPAGFAPAAAAVKIAWLLEAMRARGLSGVALKDDAPEPAQRLQGPIA